MNDTTRPRILRPHTDDRRATSALHDGVSRGELVRLHTAGYVATADLAGLTPRQRHVLRVHAAMPRLHPRCVVSHGSAAAVHRLASLGPPPDRVHVTDPARNRAQTWNGVAKHARPLDESEVVVDGVRVTSLARTAADIALSWNRAQAVVVLDDVLHRTLVRVGEIETALDARPTARGRSAARRALAFASGDAESAGESLCRVLLSELGAPVPELQHVFRDDRGDIGAVDFWFAGQGAVLEFDGFVKYSNPRWHRDKSPAEIAFLEKRREDRIRRLAEVRAFGRCVWAELEQPQRLASVLRAAGVPLLRPP